jgi:hypothetical protein
MALLYVEKLFRALSDEERERVNVELHQALADATRLV